MKIKNRFRYYRILGNMWKFSFLLSLCVVVVLELTNWRPLGCSSNADSINRFMATLSYSIIGANLFYCFNEYLPSLSRSHVSKEYVSHQLWEIKEQLRLLVEMDLHPFSLEWKSITRESYVVDFESTDLKEQHNLVTSLSKEEVINKRKDKIVSVCNELLPSYMNVLTWNQLEFLNTISGSIIVRVGLRPTIWDEDNKPIASYDDNQSEIAQCIYTLFEQSKDQLK